jgi:hypothetical protein
MPALPVTIASSANDTVAGASATDDATAALPNKCVNFLFIYIFSIEMYFSKFTYMGKHISCHKELFN